MTHSMLAAALRHSSLSFAGPARPRLEEGEYLIVPPHGWTCFHCGETYTDYWAARAHFGTPHMKVKPRCIRRAERLPNPTQDAHDAWRE